MKCRSIQINLQLTRTNLEHLRHDAGSVLINLYQLIAFNRVDYQYMAALLQAARFNPDICRKTGSDRALLRCHGRIVSVVHYRPYFTILPLEPILYQLRDGACRIVLCEVNVPGGARAGVFIFISSRGDIEMVREIHGDKDETRPVLVCGYVLRRALPFQGPSVGSTVPSTFLECDSDRVSS